MSIRRKIKRIETNFDNDEQILLKDAFSVFMLVIQDRGAYKLELLCLRKILEAVCETSLESNEVYNVLIKLDSLLDVVLPEQIDIDIAAETYQIAPEVLEKACQEARLPCERREKILIRVSDLEEYLLREMVNAMQAGKCGSSG